MATREERLGKSNSSRIKFLWYNQEWNIAHPAILLPFLQNEKTVVCKNNYHKWIEPGEVDTSHDKTHQY